MNENEKMYKTLGSSGAWNIVIGVVVLVCGTACGIIAIINGARMLKRKSDIII